MTDDELLAAAAKAAGIQLRWFSHLRRDGVDLEPKIAHIGNTEWNPLADDADALRLAVKLRIKFRYNEALGQGLAWTGGATDFEGRADIEKCGRDENACARLAIVRAAAAMAPRPVLGAA